MHRLDSLPHNFWTIVSSHAIFCVMVVYNNVLARFRRITSSQIEASVLVTFIPILLAHRLTRDTSEVAGGK